MEKYHIKKVNMNRSTENRNLTDLKKDTESIDKELITIGTKFLDYALNNQQYNGCDKVGQICHVQCGVYKKIITN